MSRVPWSAQEDATLAELYPHASQAAVAEALPGRTWRTIGWRARVTKVRRMRSSSVTREMDPIFQQLKRLRRSKQIMQRDLCAKMGIRLCTLSAWENGRNQPTWPLFRAWLTALGAVLDVKEPAPIPKTIPWEGIKPLTREQLMSRRAA